MELAFDRRELRFAQPLATAFGMLHSRELVEVTLTGADGIAGYGEAAASCPTRNWKPKEPRQCQQ